MNERTRPEWPHTIDDIRSSLDGIWGLIGAVTTKGDLVRLERSLYEPLTYTIIQFSGTNEDNVSDQKTYTAKEKENAILDFAALLDF